MLHSKRLAAGTMLLAFNVSIGLSAVAPAFAGQQAALPMVQLAQANPADMTEEELRKQRRQQRRQNAAEEQPAAPQTTPQAPVVVEPRQNQKQLRREQRQEQKQEQRQEKRLQRQEKPAQRAEPDVRKPAQPVQKVVPAEKPRREELRKDTQKKVPANDLPKKVEPVERKEAPVRKTNPQVDTPPVDLPANTRDPGSNNRPRDGKPGRDTTQVPPAGTPEPKTVTPGTPETVAPGTPDTVQEVTTPREFRDPAARPQRERATREQLRERRNERREQVRSRPEQPRIREPLAPVTAEPGERIRREDAVTHRRPDQDNVRDSRRFGDRTVLRLGDGRLVVERGPDENRRMLRNSRDVVIERLPGQRQRETITRPNGSSVVTIYNRYGDIIRRSRINPDGREIVIFILPADRWDRTPGWDRDPGYDLPPIVIGVPYDDYIWEPEQASADDYYDFLYQPPVETSERLYSVDEVRRSARLRQKLPRVDLSTVTFALGSAEVREGDVQKLEALAEGMNRILKENPGETFLIEGHTDAIGSEEANLALSDRRAEAVAVALTDVFGLPAENLVTQGYGESDLKVATESAEERNRRVTVRRITALVTDSNAQVSAR